MRIVSLVPSLTETIAQSELRSSLVGMTNFCVHPPSLHKTVEIVGGTKDPDLSLIEKLSPTHVILNAEENEPGTIDFLRRKYKTHVTKPFLVEHVPQMLTDMGIFLGEEKVFENLAQSIRTKLKAAGECVVNRKSGLYFIWKDPLMIAGQGTYISSALDLFGIENCVEMFAGRQSSRYPSAELEALKKNACDIYLLSSEPWPFRKRDANVFQGIGHEGSKIIKVDGKLFSWYGSTTSDLLDVARKYHEKGVDFWEWSKVYTGNGAWE